MPTERFFHLPEEKKQRIVAAAGAELARVPWDQFSINKIVQTAEIPRGSFYQYFSDKMDVLWYLMEDFMQDAQQRVLTSITETGGDLFHLANMMLNVVLEYGFREENYPAFRNLFPYLRLQDAGKLFPFLQADPDPSLEECCQPARAALETIFQAPQYAGIPQETLMDTVELLLAQLQYTIAQIFFHVEQKQQIQRSFQNKLRLLKQGLFGKEFDHVEI